jgi:S-adenosylmethionine hydrolase
MSVIALISDFGTQDWFVSELKARILTTAPQTTIVDITHEIPYGDLRTTAFVMSIVYRQFPVGTVFCQTVDPGSFTTCPIIVAQSAEYTFISPDNGALSWVFSDTKPNSIHVCSNPVFITNTCSTFRGRDIIAPVAAHCALGTSLVSLGPEIGNLVTIPFPEILEYNDCITAEILYIDHFGNIITAIANHRIKDYILKKMSVEINGNTIQMAVASSYGSATVTTPLIYQGSSGFVEIAFTGTNAAEFFNVKSGDKITLHYK